MEEVRLLANSLRPGLHLSIHCSHSLLPSQSYKWSGWGSRIDHLKEELTGVPSILPRSDEALRV
uniref:Uncharacterized protein n=1 Tax=Oryza rufipogon TaxID=4529 RepID=A0A0E0P691_ORYRU